ncbi:transmembrane protein fuseless [Oratosquilla oratoria]|uniref:transmembrane protein fuseless n=1 Tax=Oratosquilla oratoria TaxID=337810 RepID=UPI003F77011B
MVTRAGGARKKIGVGHALLAVLDSLFSILVVSPLVVGYWRGTWQLMDIYLLPGNKAMSVWTSLAIGLFCGLFFCFLHEPMTRCFDHERRPQLHLLMARLYTFVFCVGCVNHWRGVWAAWDLYTGTSWQSGVTSAGIGLLTLGICRGLKNILAPPFVIIPDHPRGYFDFPTMFEAKKDRCFYFVLDTLFTVVLVSSLVVFVWRGAWVALDDLLFPDNTLYSAWGSMVLGLAVVVVVFMAQLAMIPCLRRLSKGVCKVLVEDIYHTICFVGAINIWRGVWNLLNIYLFPDMYVVSNWLTSVAGICVLMCFYCSNSILVRGASMDGALEGAKGVAFSTHYFRFFLRKRLRRDPIRREEYWVRKDETRALRISAPLDASNKPNGVCDGRVFVADGGRVYTTDGRVYTSTTTDPRSFIPSESSRGFGENPRRPNSTFLPAESPNHAASNLIRAPGYLPDLKGHQTETLL